MVLEILRDIPETRNDDVKLTIEIWKKFYPRIIRYDAEGVMVVQLCDITHLPREDHIKRYRTKIQNDELKYPPTNWMVAKQRKYSEEVWRKAMSAADAHARVEDKMEQENA